MRSTVCRCVNVAAFVAAVVLACASPVAAQFRPDGPAIGERYHIEGAASFWNPTPSAIVSSEELGIPGDDIDLVEDLGIERKQLRELRLVLRPARKHKFRLQYLPLKYEATSAVQREFVFNGLRYRVGLPVTTSVDVATLRLGYEYDFIYRERGYFGVIFDLKKPNLRLDIASPLGPAFFEIEEAWLPTIGVAGRGYVLPNVAITGEFSFIKVPENISGGDFGGRYFDYDFSGTVNFNNYVGAQVGVRSVDLEAFSDLDRGNLKFVGMYFGAVVRY
jgi:hypothetical protein